MDIPLPRSMQGPAESSVIHADAEADGKHRSPYGHQEDAMAAVVLKELAVIVQLRLRPPWRHAKMTDEPSYASSAPLKLQVGDQLLATAIVNLSPLCSGFPFIRGWYHLQDSLQRCQGQIKLSLTLSRDKFINQHQSLDSVVLKDESPHESEPDPGVAGSVLTSYLKQDMPSTRNILAEITSLLPRFDNNKSDFTSQDRYQNELHAVSHRESKETNTEQINLPTPLKPWSLEDFLPPPSSMDLRLERQLKERQSQQTASSTQRLQRLVQSLERVRENLEWMHGDHAALKHVGDISVSDSMEHTEGVTLSSERPASHLRVQVLYDDEDSDVVQAADISEMHFESIEADEEALSRNGGRGPTMQHEDETRGNNLCQDSDYVSANDVSQSETLDDLIEEEDDELSFFFSNPAWDPSTGFISSLAHLKYEFKDNDAASDEVPVSIVLEIVEDIVPDEKGNDIEVLSSHRSSSDVADRVPEEEVEDDMDAEVVDVGDHRSVSPAAQDISIADNDVVINTEKQLLDTNSNLIELDSTTANIEAAAVDMPSSPAPIGSAQSNPHEEDLVSRMTSSLDTSFGSQMQTVDGRESPELRFERHGTDFAKDNHSTKESGDDPRRESDEDSHASGYMSITVGKVDPDTSRQTTDSPQYATKNSLPVAPEAEDVAATAVPLNYCWDSDGLAGSSAQAHRSSIDDNIRDIAGNRGNKQVREENNSPVALSMSGEQSYPHDREAGIQVGNTLLFSDRKDEADDVRVNSAHLRSLIEDEVRRALQKPTAVSESNLLNQNAVRSLHDGNAIEQRDNFKSSFLSDEFSSYSETLSIAGLSLPNKPFARPDSISHYSHKPVETRREYQNIDDVEQEISRLVRVHCNTNKVNTSGNSWVRFPGRRKRFLDSETERISQIMFGKLCGPSSH